MADDITKLNVTSEMSAAAADLSPAPDTAPGDDPFAETKSELTARYALLPDDIKSVIVDAGYQQKLFDLAKAQKLTYEELGVLETETTMVLLGMTKPADYRAELQRELKKNDSDIDVLVNAVNEQVFAPIRASLERVYTAKKEPEDYIPESIVSGVEEKPKEPIFAAVPTAAPVGPALNAMPLPSSSLSSAEKNVLLGTGVVINTAPVPAAPFAQSEIPNRAEMLKGIENPRTIPMPASAPVQPAAAPAVTAPKPPVAAPVISATKSTDYSMPKPSGSAPRVDPYREPID